MRNARIDGLRGLALSIVILGHLCGRLLPFTGDNPVAATVAGVLVGGQFGSGLFLFVSGFVVYARSRDDAAFAWGRFLRARAIRIFPLYWAVLAAYALLDAFTAFRGKLPLDPWAAAVCLFENASLLAPLLRHPPLIMVSWTLTYVVAGYLTIPLVARGCARAGLGTGGRLAAIAGYALAWVLAPLCWQGISANGLALALGMLACEAGRAGRWRRWRAIWFDAAAAAVFPAAAWYLLHPAEGESPWRYPLYLTACASPLLLLVAGRLAGGGWLNRALSAAPAQWMAKLSYACYFAHGFAQLAMAMVLDASGAADRAPATLLLAVCLPLGYLLSVTAAAALHYGLERPLYRLLQSATSPPAARRAAAAAQAGASA